MTTAPSVKEDRKKKRAAVLSKILDGISTGIVYVALILGIVLGKILTNYSEGMEWADITIPTSLDVFATVIFTLPTTVYFENAGKTDPDTGKLKPGHAAGKKRNVFKRCFMAFFTGIGSQHIAGAAL
mgnify:CR=1 FL=1